MKKNILFIIQLVLFNSCGGGDGKKSTSIAIESVNFSVSSSNSSSSTCPSYTVSSENTLHNKYKKVITGHVNTCLIDENSSLSCVGVDTDNYSISDVKDVSLYGHHMCVLLNDNTIKCIGSNHSGQLGRGNTTEDYSNFETVPLKNDITICSIHSGYNHTCAVYKNKQIICWGENSAGQLGIGNKLNQGDNENEVSNLDYVKYTDNSVLTVDGLATGGWFTCAIVDNQSSVVCWGSDSNGQITAIENTNITQPNSSLKFSSTGRKFIKIDASEKSICALFDDQSVVCWGQGDFGKLGNGTTKSTSDSTNFHEVSPIAMNAIDISVGQKHACVITSANNVKCWGRGVSGKLGIGDTSDQDNMQSAQAVILGTNVEAQSVSCGSGDSGFGYGQSCVLTNLSGVKCWGNNGSGQLGLSETTNRGENISDMGDDLPFINL